MAEVVGVSVPENLHRDGKSQMKRYKSISFISNGFETELDNTIDI